MAYQLDPPLAPRQGGVLDVLGICRISTLHQDVRSLDDQEALIRRYVSDHYNGPVSFHCLKAQERGEHLERVDLDEAVRRVENGLVDVVISEDLGRICRRNFVIGFCELCEDHNTRLITLNDNIDTARDDWNTHAVFSAFRHESYNKETAKRIRRSLRNRFSLGGIVQTTVFGHVKPEGAKSDDKLHKDPNAEPIYDEMFRRLEDGASFGEVSDWLNSLGIPPGRYCRSDRWDRAMVGRLVRNPILKDRHGVFGTGRDARRFSVPATWRVGGIHLTR